MIVIGHLNQSDAGHWSEIKEDNDCSLDSKSQSNAFYCTVHWSAKKKTMIVVDYLNQSNGFSLVKKDNNVAIVSYYCRLPKSKQCCSLSLAT